MPMKLPTREQLEKRRAIVIADAQMKLDIADWHGCCDACMDLREIEAQLTLWDTLREHGALIGANVLEQTGIFAPAPPWNGRSDFEQAEIAARNRQAIERSAAASGWADSQLDPAGALLPDGTRVGPRVI